MPSVYHHFHRKVSLLDYFGNFIRIITPERAEELVSECKAEPFQRRSGTVKTVKFLPVKATVEVQETVVATKDLKQKMVASRKFTYREQIMIDCPVYGRVRSGRSIHQHKRVPELHPA